MVYSLKFLLSEMVNDPMGQYENTIHRSAEAGHPGTLGFGKRDLSGT